MLTLDVLTDGSPWTCLGPASPSRAARKAAAAVAANLALPGRRCAATVLLSDDDHVRVLNRHWRGFDEPTNVLSFASPAPSPGGARTSLHLGDIILAQETLAREAAELQIAPGDHFTHLVLHGLLHLLGYDHETDAEAHVMETLETRLLSGLGIADPHAGADPLGQEPATPVRRTTSRTPR